MKFTGKDKTMKTKTILFIGLSLVLILNACSPFTITSSSGQQPTPVIETSPALSYQPVDVDQVQVEIGFGSPIPVQVIVSGNLPDTCAQLELSQQQQEGSTFHIRLWTVPSNAEGCVQDTLPFKINLPLNIVNLPAGSYAVDVNGSRATFDVDTANTTSSLPAADSVITQDDIQVDSVNIEVGVGSPIPVHAIVGLSQLNTCAQLGEIRLHREGTTFYVRLIAHIAERADCQAEGVSIPFRAEIPLNIVNLPEGPYEVNVNGVTASFDPRAKPAGNSNLADFESQLQAALTQRDAQAMRALMGERFIMAAWQSEGESIPSDEALNQLITNYVGEHNFIAFQDFQNIPGFDPQAFVGPDMELAKAVFVTGWGLDGKADALLFIVRRPDGSLFWQSMLVTPVGFAPPVGEACTEPVEVPSVNGKVSYNGISFSLDQTLDYGLAARVCPASSGQGQQMVNEAHPPYTQFFFPTYIRQNIDFQPEVRVYEVTGDLQNYLFPLNVLGDLQAVIDQRPEPVTWFNPAPLHARQAYLNFANGAGVRGLVQYMQDFFFFTNNGLLYEFNGLTQDGRYFVNVRYPLGVPFLMELANPVTLPPTNLNPQAIAIPEWPSDFEQQRQIIEAYNAEALSRLEQMPDREALPNIALLDELVQSIQVSKP
jgi:hypothetical protein